MGEYRAKVLIVDDDPAARKILQSRLKMMNFQSLVASSGSEGLEEIRREAPSIVLLDLQMPRMSGIDVLKALKRERLETTVIVVTAHATIATAWPFLNSCWRASYLAMRGEPSRALIN